MAAIQTTLTLRDDVSKRLKTIEKRVKSLAKTMGAYNRGVVTSGKRMEALSKQVNKVATATKKLGSTSKDVNKLNTSLNQTKQNALSTKNGVDNLTRSVKRLATAYLGTVGIGTVLDTADKITASQNKMSTVYKMENPNASDSETNAVVQGQLNDIFASAQRSRSSYTNAVQNVGKMLINAGDVFEGNIDKAIAFNELMAKSYTIGGASDKEQNTSMYQLIQAMGAGVLAGDELRSVREGAQVAYEYIEKYAQELYNTNTSLKDLASKGLITSDVVANAILKNADAINSMFNDTQVTFEQTATIMKNNFLKAFEPVLQKLTTLLNNEDFQSMLTSMTSAFIGMANIVLDGLAWISRAWSFVTDNATTFRNILIGVVIPALILWGAQALIAGIKAAIAFAIANWQLMLIMAAIVLLIFAFLQWGDIVGIVAGVIVGIIWGVLVAFWDVILIIANLIIFLGNVFAGIGAIILAVFTNLWADLKTGFWGLVEIVLSCVKWIMDALNKIPGVSLDTSGVSDGINNAAKQRADAWASRKGYGEAWDEGYHSMEYFELIDPVAQGIEVGKQTSDIVSGASDTVNDWLDGIGNSFTSNEDTFGGKDWETTIKNGTAGLGDDVGAIRDEIELTREDLDYLRELAEMEAINRFTTAEIKVDMSNYNTINGENDLDGLVEKLSEKIEEEMHIVAEGTY